MQQIFAQRGLRKEGTVTKTKLGGRTDEVRIGMSIYWVETRPEAEGERQGFRWSAVDGKVGGWAWGSRAQALREAREALLTREVLYHIVVKQDEPKGSKEK